MSEHGYACVYSRLLNPPDLQLGKFTDLRTVLVVGGDSMEEQFSAIHGNPDV